MNSEASLTVLESSSSRIKAPPDYGQFRSGEDVIDFLMEFEDYHEKHNIDKGEWAMKLVDKLKDVNVFDECSWGVHVYTDLPDDHKWGYDQIKMALLRHFQIDEASLSVLESSSSRIKAPPDYGQFQSGEDVIDFLMEFEDYHEKHNIDKGEWAMKLVDKLKDVDVFDECSWGVHVYTDLPDDHKWGYDQIKMALLRHFQIDCFTYIRKWEELSRKPGETWASCASRGLRLVKGLSSNCHTVDDVQKAVVLNKLLQIMPEHMATQVKMRKLKTLNEAAKWADK